MSCLSCWLVLSMNTTFVNPFRTNYTSLKTFHPYFAILFCQEHDIFYNTVGLKSENKRCPFKIFHHSMLFCKIGVTYISFCFQSKTDNYLVPEKLKKYEEFKRLGFACWDFILWGQNLAKRQRANLSLNLSGLWLML